MSTHSTTVKEQKVSPLANLNAEALANLILENKKIHDDFFDISYARALTCKVLHLINEVYFRPVFVGFDDMPNRKDTKYPVIFASNHSGMAFPWDAIIFKSAIFEKQNYQLNKVVRALIAPVLSHNRLMNPFMIDHFWKRVGGVDATFLNFETMMHNPDTNLLIYPEGIAGIGKGFNRKYQLQQLATSFVRISLKYRADIQPFATINAEYINPYTYSFSVINKQSAKMGISFLPIGVLTIFLLFQPWLFYYAWPAKLTFIRGQRIKPYEWLDKPFEEMTEEDIQLVRDRIHDQMQTELTEAVVKHGQVRFNIKELFRKMWTHKQLFPFYLPFGWPLLFREFERQYSNNKGKQLDDIQLNLGWGAFFRLLYHNPVTICYFIPILGWIPLAIMGFRKPKPYGAQQTRSGKVAILLAFLLVLGIIGWIGIG